MSKVTFSFWRFVAHFQVLFFSVLCPHTTNIHNNLNKQKRKRRSFGSFWSSGEGKLLWFNKIYSKIPRGIKKKGKEKRDLLSSLVFFLFSLLLSFFRQQKIFPQHSSHKELFNCLSLANKTRKRVKTCSEPLSYICFQKTKSECPNTWEKAERFYPFKTFKKALEQAFFLFCLQKANRIKGKGNRTGNPTNFFFLAKIQGETEELLFIQWEKHFLVCLCYTKTERSFFSKKKKKLSLCVYFFSFGEHKMISPRKTETQKNRRRPVFDFQNLWARGSSLSLSLSKEKEKERETSLSKRRKRIGIYKFKRMNKARPLFLFFFSTDLRKKGFWKPKSLSSLRPRKKKNFPQCPEKFQRKQPFSFVKYFLHWDCAFLLIWLQTKRCFAIQTFLSEKGIR